MSIPDIFGRPLLPDPAVALKPFAPAQTVPGPQHKVQYVVELVGPRTMAAEAVKSLTDKRWMSALGNPEVYVMGLADDRWRPFAAADPANAYDSLAFAWDFVTGRGSLSNAAAQNLLNVAEQLGAALSRRAMPMPPPSDVEPAVRAVEQAAENLDIGVGLSLIARAAPLPEKEVWQTCAALGLQVGGSGLFEWRVPGWDDPIVTLSSLDDKETFSLDAVIAGKTHPGLSVGYRVPRSPNSVAALDACLRVAGRFEAALGTITLDDSDEPLDEAGKQRLIGYHGQAVAALRAVGLEPGSAAALKVFV
jgi:hypothetical protein